MTSSLESLPTFDLMRPDRLFRLSKGLGMVAKADAAANTDGCYAKARICTPRIDREGDIIEPSGVKALDYVHNPVVMYDHGLSGVYYPVGNSVTPENKLTLELIDNALFATSYHSPNIRLHQEVFSLINEGFLRATSIHVIPTDGMVKALPDGGYHVVGSDIIEWSWCALQCNPDAFSSPAFQKAFEPWVELVEQQSEAATRILNRGTLNGEAISLSLAKSLNAIQPAKKNQARVLENPMPKTLTAEQVEKLTLKECIKAWTSNEYDTESITLLQAKAKSMPDEPVVEPEKKTDPTMEEDENNDEPLGEEEAGYEKTGAQVLAKAHSALQDFAAYFKKSLLPVEESRVTGGSQEVLDGVSVQIGSIESLHKSIYGTDLKIATEEPTDEAVKAWLATNKSGVATLEAYAHRLTKALNTKTSEVERKALLKGTFEGIHSLLRAVEKFKSEDNIVVKKAAYEKTLDQHKKMAAILTAKQEEPLEIKS